MAKKHRSKNSPHAPGKRGAAPSPSTPSAAPAVAGEAIESPSLTPTRAVSTSSAQPEVSAVATMDAAVVGGALDPEAHDRFASSFTPTWQVPETARARAKPEPVAPRPESLSSGEFSRDSIPLPPLPTTKPSRGLSVAIVVVILFILAGVFASTRQRPEPVPPPTSSSRASEP